MNYIENFESLETIPPNSLILGDCLEVMKKIESKSIQLILCDLPYGTTACAWDVIIPFEPLWKEYKRILKDNGTIALTASQPFTSALVMSNVEMFKYEWIWEKSKASNFLLAKKVPLKAHENVCIFYNSCIYNPQKTIGKPFNRGIRKHTDGVATEVYNKITNPEYSIENIDGYRLPRSVQYFTTAEIDGSYHPTQKPVALMEYMIKTYTNENDLVLDNCMGGCSTGVAAINTKRNFIGIEKLLKFYNISKNRIKEHISNQTNNIF
jgi:DNA modification methylase